MDRAVKCHVSLLFQALRQISQRTISTASRRQLENRVSESQKLFQVMSELNNISRLTRF